MFPSVGLKVVIVTPCAEAKFTAKDWNTGPFAGSSLALGFVADGVL